MRLHSLSGRGLGPFRTAFHVDIDALPGRVIGICGGNGEGKSTLLELFPGALHRECPTRGSLVDLAQERDAYLEARVTNGAFHTLRHTVDGISKKSEALILDDSGAPVLATTSVKAFDEWSKVHLPDAEVLLCSAFAAQQHRGFCDLGARERKTVLATILGIAGLEEMAGRARKRATTVETELAGLEGERRALPALDVDMLVAGLPVSEEAARAADEALAAGRRDVDAGIAYRRASSALIAARPKLDELVEKLADVDERIANNRKLIAKGPRIRAATERCRAIRDEIILLTSQGQTAGTLQRATEQRRQEAAGRAAAARAAIQAAERRADAARSRAARRVEVEEAEGELPGARDALAAVEREITRLRAEEREVQDGAIGGAEARVKGLRSGLDKIALPAATVSAKPSAIARATLDADTVKADAQRSAPARVAAIRAGLERNLHELDAARDRVAALSAVAGLRATVDAAAGDLARALEDAESARAAEQEASVAALAIAEEVEAARRAAIDRSGRIAALEREERELATDAHDSAMLAQAPERLAEREEQAAILRAEIAETRTAITALEAEIATLPPPAEIDLSALEEAARRAQASVVRLTAEIERARAGEARRSELDAAIIALRAELADWNLLAEDLGPRGLPALLIDAAGPELTELVNDLLHTCVGPRFTVSIDTTRPTADGKKSIETCDVRVLDTEKGREGPVETFSGGERVILGEAVSLALSVLALRRSGAEAPTLVRDESGAALDEERARAWMAMLRRAADIIGASKVLVVSHVTELQDLCDAKLVVANGTITVEAA